MTSLTLGDVVAILEQHYPPSTAAPWDAVGLVAGDPRSPVHTVALAVDPTEETAREALDVGAGLLLTHHPLYLRGTSGVAATTPKGRVVHELIRGGCGLYTAHTNADAAIDGVNEALADLLGLQDRRPISPHEAGGATGLGRIGELAEPMTLRAFAEFVAQVLPSTAPGIRVGGDLEAKIRTVALCGGAGDSLLSEVRELGADVYLTADLRHHPASEYLAEGPPYLVDATHWASEWPWLPRAASLVQEAARARGAALEVHVSTTVTDPWALVVGGSAP